jgi:hypothetical protein
MRFFLYHTAFKLYSLWHVGYLHDDFYGFSVCSYFDLFTYSFARHPDFIKPPQRLGFTPSYFSTFVTPHLPS